MANIMTTILIFWGGKIKKRKVLRIASFGEKIDSSELKQELGLSLAITKKQAWAELCQAQ